MPELTEKQRKFVEAYMGEACGNATEAARIAGYSGNSNTVAQTGFQLLRNPKVAAAIEERRKACPLALTREESIALLSRIARGQEQDDTLEHGTVRMADRLKAIAEFNKVSGLHLDRSVTIDLASLSEGQLARLAAGEPLERVVGE